MNNFTFGVPPKNEIEELEKRNLEIMLTLDVQLKELIGETGKTSLEAVMCLINEINNNSIEMNRILKNKLSDKCILIDNLKYFADDHLKIINEMDETNESFLNGMQFILREIKINLGG